MMSKQQRNDAVREFITAKLDQAEKSAIEEFHDLPDFEEVNAMLESLINVKQMGFRGVVATVIAGKFINESFDPLNDFYSCNPRSIFEGGIFYALRGRVPCGKSDPLNVAKNQSVLDENWASGRRPASSAKAAVDFIRLLERSATHSDKLVDFYFYKLMQYAKSVEKIKVVVPETENSSKLHTAKRLTTFVLDYPESGTIPQLVVGKLLKAVVGSHGKDVFGGDESVFGTNTTSKKPADLWVEAGGEVINLYEVTVKKVDYKRLDDAIEHVASLGLIGRPLTFICRIPLDISSLESASIQCNSALFNYNGKEVEFIDIESFIKSLCALMSEAELNAIVEEVAAFVEDIQRPVTTKDGWNQVFGDL